jgi:hypothetical protein
LGNIAHGFFKKNVDVEKGRDALRGALQEKQLVKRNSSSICARSSSSVIGACPWPGG